MSVQVIMAFRSSVRNWRHSLATLSSVGLGLMAVSLVDAFLRDIRIQSSEVVVNRNMYGHLLIEGIEEANDDNPWLSYMNQYDVQKVEAELKKFGDDIVTYNRMFPIQGMAEGAGTSVGFFGYAYDVVAGDTMRGAAWRWNTIYGQPLTISEKPKALVGRGLAELLGCDMTQVKASNSTREGTPVPLDCFQQSVELTGLTEKGQVNALDVELEGVIDIGFRDLEDAWMVMPLAQAQQFFDTQKISTIGVFLKDENSRERVIAQLEKRLADMRLPIRVMRWEEHKVAEFYRESHLIHVIFRNFIFLIVVVVCALSLTNTITRSIIQRTREIGTLRAVGFKRRFIKSLFAWEGLFLGLFGSMLGIVGASIIATSVNAAGITYVPGFISTPVPLRLVAEPEVFLQLAGTLTLLSCLIAWVIASFRSSKSIAESLIHN